MEVQTISTLEALKAFLKALPSSSTNGKPNLYLDLEGNNLGRRGTLSLITVLVEPRHTMHLIDVHTLGKQAFTTADEDNKTLQQILESNDIIKVFFDIRNDSDALFSLFGVRVGGIEDLQLMELAARRSSKRLVNGLKKCIDNDAKLSVAEKQAWSEAKDKGNKLFSPQLGGSYAVFDQRPLNPEIEKYCVQDVVHMPGLREVYQGMLSNVWKNKAKAETVARITDSQSAGYVGQGQHKAQGPAAWQPAQYRKGKGKGKGSYSMYEFDDDGYDS